MASTTAGSSSLIIRVEVGEQLSGDIVCALLDGLADLGVSAEGTPSHDLRTRPFQSDELVVACSREHVPDDCGRSGARRIAARRAGFDAGPEKFKALRLREPWAERNLVVATKADAPPTPATTLLLEHLQSATAG